MPCRAASGSTSASLAGLAICRPNYLHNSACGPQLTLADTELDIALFCVYSVHYCSVFLATKTPPLLKLTSRICSNFLVRRHGGGGSLK